MKSVILIEQCVAKLELSARQHEALRGLSHDGKPLSSLLKIVPRVGEPDCYEVSPGSHVGAFFLPDLAVVIQPKIPIQRLLFLMSYALNPKSWHTDPLLPFHFGVADSLFEAIIPGFVAHVRQAFRHGLLHGYRVEEASLATVRGRVRFDDQIRCHYGLMPPVEVRYDEFTEDIEANRLIKAAIRKLRHLPIRSKTGRRTLHTFDSLLATVSAADYDSRSLPEVRYDRLNGHYRSAIELAKLILRSISFELSHGQIENASFIIDMNKVFEDFVAVALREALGLSERVFLQNVRGKLFLDKTKKIELVPDLSWWDAQRCSFVGDVKYKDIRAHAVDRTDLYQLLGYVTGANLPNGVLVYAAGPAEKVTYRVVHAEKELSLVALDLSTTPERILAQMNDLATIVKCMRKNALNSIAH